MFRSIFFTACLVMSSLSFADTNTVGVPYGPANKATVGCDCNAQHDKSDADKEKCGCKKKCGCDKKSSADRE